MVLVFYNFHLGSDTTADEKEQPGEHREPDVVSFDSPTGTFSIRISQIFLLPTTIITV